MKKLSITLITIVLQSIYAHAQHLKPNVINSGKSSSFKADLVHALKDDNTGNRISVYNSKNIYHEKNPKNRNLSMSVIRGDKGGTIKSFTQVFSDQRLKQLLPERFMYMTLFVDTSGKILEVEFFLNDNTLITANELEELEKAVKANVWFKIRPEEIQGQGFFVFTYGAVYSRLLDRTQADGNGGD